MPGSTSKTLKRWLYALGVGLGLLMIGGAVALFSWGRNSKAQVQAAASAALGMQVTIGGELKVRVFPGFGMTLHEVRIENQGSELAAAQEARLKIELLPLLLHRQIRIPVIVLTHVTLAIEQGRDGKFNFEVPSSAGAARPQVDWTDVSLADVSLVYTDKQNGNEWRAESCDMQSGRLQISAAKAADLINSLAITGAASCKQIQTRKLALSDVKFTLDAKQGLFEFKDITMRAYDGRGSGTVHANFTGHVPTYRVHYVLASFRIEEFWKNFSQKKIGAGLMNFSTDLTLRGYTVRELTESSVGEASLRGSNLTLAIGDLDGELSRYESTQKFSLIDVGAFLVVGPIGLAVTKGYDFARVLGTADGSSAIPSLTSEWQIEHGVALAKDVAMTTLKNRIALKGALDFVNDRYQDVTVALVNKQGCVRVQQTARGPFNQPDVEKPNVLVSMAGPVHTLFKQAKHMLGGHCEVFYAGSLPPPG
jgi:AsmA protein